MPAKKSEPTPSHDAAQKRVWKSDLKQLESMRRKVGRDFDAARKPLYKAFLAARRKLDAYDKREEKLRPRAVAKIDRRIGIVKGRLGI